ncbi:hypothetical protein L218DRAFT_1004201 [Marasmius fiardii PR-910]|nr:hypothetical protein L218DRAFT_1004201 [Marasmius fiardii PR-910]
MVGYEGRGMYQCKVWDSDDVIRSRNVIFEEGDRHWVTAAEGEDDEDDVSNDVSFVNSATATPDTATDTQLGMPMIQNSSAGENGPLLVSEFSNRFELPHLPRPSTSTPAQTNPPPAPCHHPFIDSRQYETEEQQAHDRGENWATDTPLLPEFDERETSITLQTDGVTVEPDNHWIPQSYEEAYMRMDL